MTRLTFFVQTAKTDKTELVTRLALFVQTAKTDKTELMTRLLSSYRQRRPTRLS